VKLLLEKGAELESKDKMWLLCSSYAGGSMITAAFRENGSSLNLQRMNTSQINMQLRTKHWHRERKQGSDAGSFVF
jgi:hypothetical protein